MVRGGGRGDGGGSGSGGGDGRGGGGGGGYGRKRGGGGGGGGVGEGEGGERVGSEGWQALRPKLWMPRLEATEHSQKGEGQRHAGVAQKRSYLSSRSH